jgi:hypothetical protein
MACFISRKVKEKKGEKLQRTKTDYKKVEGE